MLMCFVLYFILCVFPPKHTHQNIYIVGCDHHTGWLAKHIFLTDEFQNKPTSVTEQVHEPYDEPADSKHISCTMCPALKSTAA